jgi:sensor c-di-GMP phosphodiesterase-like protein
MHFVRRFSGALLICAAIVAAALPILISLHLSYQQSLAEQSRDVRQLAGDVLRRADETNLQMISALDKLRDLGSADPCSDQNVTLMARIAVASEQIQGLGLVKDDQLLCSSFGRYTPAISVGPPDYVTANKVAMRTAVALPEVTDVKFILVTRQETGYSAIVHPKLPLDVFVDNAELSVGLVNYAQMKPIDIRGTYDPDWIKVLGTAQSIDFADDRHVVAVKRSTTGDFVAFAAIPAARVEIGVRHFALVLLPLGLLTGLVLALAMLRLVRMQQALPSVIKSALRREEFFLDYQPVVDLRTGAWTGAEALLRWRRSNGELVRPDVFIPVAEETGLIERITDQVIELICQDAGDLFQRHPEFHIAVNVSAADVQLPRLHKLVARLIEGTGGSPGNFVLEITERGLVKGDAAKDFLHGARQMGARTAIDDFGTGYSSLSYLQTFDFDLLKIDKSFVDTIGAHAATSHVVSHIVDMAKDLGLEMVAEGVETESQRVFLQKRGVRYAQGWLFAKPMPMAELKHRLEALAQAQSAG